MYCPVPILCKNPSENKAKRMEQAIMCSIIEGYTDATAELSQFINKLYRDKNPNASVIYHALEPLIKQQNDNYNKLCDQLNEI